MQIRNRNLAIRRVKANTLLPNPQNYRTHPQEQHDALRGILAEVGFVGTLLAYELPNGHLQLIDGHLRGEELTDNEVDVCVVDLTEEEAKKVLATHDGLTGMAEMDEAKFRELMEELEFESPALKKMMEEIEGGSGEGGEGRGGNGSASEKDGKSVTGDETKLNQLEVRPPPKMTWVLIGIPTVRFGEIAETVERIAKVEEIIVEMSANNGETQRQEKRQS